MAKEELIDNDITDDEWEKIHIPLQENLEKYMALIVPNIIAFSIADTYNRGGLCDSSFEIHYRSMGDILLVKPEAIEVKDQILAILEIQYGLVMVADDPMKLERAKGCDRQC